MGKRQDLQILLEELLGSDQVYFQPPVSLIMKYPCIVYQRDNALSSFADNKPYRHTKRYAVTIIDKNPDSEIPDMVAALPLTSWSRHFTADKLNHDIYSLYF